MFKENVISGIYLLAIFLTAIYSETLADLFFKVLGW